MDEFSDDDIMTIRLSPLEPVLNSLKQNLREIIDSTVSQLESLPPINKVDESSSDPSSQENVAKEVISSLLTALLGHKAAKSIKRKQAGGTIAGQLARLYNRLDLDLISPSFFLPLVNAIVKESSDVEIWKTVLQLSTSASRVTPPPSVTTSFGGTPRTYSSASHEGIEQNRRQLDGAIRDEFWDCSHKDTCGFFEKYFCGKSWEKKSDEIFNAINSKYKDGRWTSFPDPPTEKGVWQWLSEFQETHLAHARSNFYTSGNKKEMTGIDTESQLDLLVKIREEGTSRRKISGSHDWADVQVVGEHTVSLKLNKFFQLARYARIIFSAQPRRLFLHGFILQGTTMELHIFDRSGTYSAEPFDIHEKPQQFIRALSGYCLMSNEELGLDTFIEITAGKEFITIYDDIAGEEKKIEMEPHPISYQRAVVCRGTSCYRTSDSKSVLKFSWVPSSKWFTEPELLKEARRNQVKGVAQLIGCKRVASTAELRDGLSFAKKRRIEGRLQNSMTSSSQLGKRGKTDAHEYSMTKRSRSNSQISKLSQVFGNDEGSGEHKVSQGARSVENPFINRVLSCQLLTPAGRPLCTFQKPIELLMALRDAIKGHKSLFLDAKIIQRDVSENNIIMTDPDENDGMHGMLIDLDLATSIDENGKNIRTNAQRITGTLKFMAIEILELALRDANNDLEHTYRHDLESFLYVFLSVCIRHKWAERKKAKVDPLQNWYIGSFDSIAGNKRGLMERGGFNNLVLSHFPSNFDFLKDLALVLRDLLFRKNGELYISTPLESPAILYNKIISAFDETIKKEKAQETKLTTSN